MDFGPMPGGLGLAFEVEICRLVRPSLWSACRDQFSTGLEQVLRCRQVVDLARVLRKATQAGLLRVELLLYHPKLVFEFRVDISTDWLEQILLPAFWGVWQGFVLTGSHCHSEPCWRRRHPSWRLHGGLLTGRSVARPARTRSCDSSPPAPLPARVIASYRFSARMSASQTACPATLKSAWAVQKTSWAGRVPSRTVPRLCHAR
jgi:hypothetical protein